MLQLAVITSGNLQEEYPSNDKKLMDYFWLTCKQAAIEGLKAGCKKNSNTQIRRKAKKRTSYWVGRPIFLSTPRFKSAEAKRNSH